MKVFVDHNISPHIAHALAVLAAVEGHRVRALTDDFDRTTPDTEWLRRLGQEGGWIVISGDRRIIRNPQEHLAWLRARVITFFLERGWHRGMSQFVVRRSPDDALARSHRGRRTRRGPGRIHSSGARSRSGSCLCPERDNEADRSSVTQCAGGATLAAITRALRQNYMDELL